MMSSDGGRRARERCWRDQEADDALPLGAPSGCAISVVKGEDEDEDDGDFVARVIVKYREEHELERAMLDVVLRLHDVEASASLCAGSTPSKRDADRENREDAEAIEELASVLGVSPGDAAEQLRRCNERGEPFIPIRFRELLGCERVYEVRSKSHRAALTTIRIFLLRVATAGPWTHHGVIDGPVIVELPLKYDVTLIDTPGIDDSIVARSRKLLRNSIGAGAEYKIGMFVFISGNLPPKEATWSALKEIGTLDKIFTEGCRLCLCWPVERLIESRRPDGFVTNLQIKNFTNRTLKTLNMDRNHWLKRFDTFSKESKLHLWGGLLLGMSLAFVRTLEKNSPLDSRGANKDDEQYSMYRLAYAVKRQVNPPPNDENSNGLIKPEPIYARPDSELEPRNVEPATKAKAMSEAPLPREISSPKLVTRPKKRPRECTIADPFAFTENDGADYPEDAETPPLFDKPVAKTASRAPLRNAVNAPSRATGTAKRAKKQEKSVPKAPLTLRTVQASTKPSPDLSTTASSKPVPSAPQPSPDDDKSSPVRARRLRQRSELQSPWWEVKTFTWEGSKRVQR